MPEILYQYALLNRGLDKGRSLRLNSELDLVFYQEDMNWDDGLDAFRSLFDKSIVDAVQDSEKITEKTKISLKTLSDYDWYVRFANADRLNFSVHSRQSVQLSEVLKKLGHPKPTEGVIRKDNLNALMLFALPEFTQKFEEYIQREFQWQDRPQLRNF